MSRRSVPLWCWWVPVVWVISFPWAGFTKVPQWKRVHFIPLTDPADKSRDIASNILLFVPFGYSIAGRRGASVAFILAAGAAGALSISAEATQLFSTRRYPSATDVASAAVGALLGAGVRLISARRRRTP